MATICQLLLRGVDGRTSCLRFPSPTITGSLIQEQIAAILRLPTDSLLILTGTTLVHPHTTLSAAGDGLFPSCSLLFRLRGGKGGFGSLLRGAATKAGQKKTSNFDACRDMSGRRLRHVNAEKKLKEWKSQAKERELEKAAKEFLKKQVKHKEDDSGCSQVIEKFREETSKAREEVESAVARGLAEAKRLGKRKVVEDDSLPVSRSKRAQLWFDSEIDMVEDDERDSSDDDDDAEVGSDNEDSEEGSNNFKAEEGSEDSKAEEGSERGEPKEVSEDGKAEEGIEAEKAEERLGGDDCNSCHSAHVDNLIHVKEVARANVSSPIVAVVGDLELQDKNELGSNTLLIPNDNGLQDGANESSVDRQQTQEDLNLGGFHQASDLEVLGLERLKHELQKRGLKCSGSLAERAGRLFLLKTVPLEKLDKKHFAKARA